MTATFNFFGKKLREPSTHMKLKRFTTSHDTHELIRIAILTKRYLRFLFTGLGVFRSKSSKLNGFQRCNQAYFGFTHTKYIYITTAKVAPLLYNLYVFTDTRIMYKDVHTAFYFQN